MYRALRIAAAALVGIALAAAPGACGSDEGEEQAAPGADIAPPRLATADKRAFTRIQRASGDLRAAAVPLSYGASGTVNTDTLRADVRRLRAADPRDSLLRRLRRRTLAAARALIAASPDGDAQAAAAAAIAEADRIDAGLRRYAASNPAANEIAPG